MTLALYVGGPLLFLVVGAVAMRRAARQAPPTPPQPIYPVDLIDGREIYPEDRT
jgi:hypothetical protein